MKTDEAAYIAVGAEKVYFARESKRTADAAGKEVVVISWVYWGVLFVVGFGLALAQRAYPLPLLKLMPPGAFLVVLGFLWVWRRSRRRRAARASAAFAAGYPPAEEAWRVVCVGRLERPEDAPPLSATPFEPEVFLCTFAVLSSGLRWLCVAAAVLTAITVFAGLQSVVLGRTWYDQFHLVMFAGVVAGWGAMGLLWPVYTRVTPGRLEILSWPSVLRRPLCSTEFDLRRGTLTVDYVNRALSVEDGSQTVLLPISLVPRGRRFAFITYCWRQLQRIRRRRCRRMR